MVHKLYGVGLAVSQLVMMKLLLQLSTVSVSRVGLNILTGWSRFSTAKQQTIIYFNTVTSEI